MFSIVIFYFQVTVLLLRGRYTSIAYFASIIEFNRKPFSPPCPPFPSF